MITKHMGTDTLRHCGEGVGLQQQKVDGDNDNEWQLGSVNCGESTTLISQIERVRLSALIGCNLCVNLTVQVKGPSALVLGRGEWR